MSNNLNVESDAIKAVIEFETKRLSLSDTNSIKVVKKDGYDVLSADGRTIEVKGTEGSDLSKGLVLDSRQELEHLENGGYLYRVLNCTTAPEVHTFKIDDLSVIEEFRARVTVKRQLEK